MRSLRRALLVLAMLTVGLGPVVLSPAPAAAVTVPADFSDQPV